MNRIMKRSIPMTKAFLSIFRVITAQGFQYRVAWFSGALTGIFWVLIEITVYQVFYKYADNKDAGILAGFSLRQLVTYAWLVQLFFMMQPNGILGEIYNKIINGDVGIEMCRPIDLYFHWLAKVSGSKLSPVICRGSVTIIAGILLPPPYRLALPASVDGFLCSVISMVSAFLLCSAFAMFITVIRLGITWGDGPTFIIMLIGSVLSGGYLPLQLWPKFLQGFLLVQPFAGYLDIPLRLYVGTMPPKDAVWAVGLQIIWTIFFIMAGKALMARRLKNIIIQGG